MEFTSPYCSEKNIKPCCEKNTQQSVQVISIKNFTSIEEPT
ncbi:hypothetical protein E2C01_064133 [Portunus trituberculatus]|uniref:Uncharacterized protein n=1 Tax=Portunus trituberculatus TaxID=210409 RepID=A0A5B7HCA0_PORTR|nr:hypothetical protein [Portunus trituberculatus]